MPQKIRKITLLKNGDGVEIQYAQLEVPREGDPANMSYVKKGDQKPHADLVRAFDRLTPHLLFASELVQRTADIEADSTLKRWYDEYKFHDDERFDGVSVTAVVFVGKESLDGVKLIGRKETSNGDVVPINSPIIYFDKAADNKYPMLDILMAQIETIQTEGELWRDGKTVAKAQMELEIK